MPSRVPTHRPPPHTVHGDGNPEAPEISKYLDAIRRRLKELHKREEVFLAQAEAHFPHSDPPPFTLRKCGERQREVYQKEFRTAHLNFWEKKKPQYPRLPDDTPPVIRKILRVSEGKHRPKDMEGGAFIDSAVPEESERLRKAKAQKLWKDAEKKSKASNSQQKQSSIADLFRLKSPFSGSSSSSSSSFPSHNRPRLPPLPPRPLRKGNGT